MIDIKNTLGETLVSVESLRWADLRRADLRRADLRRADLRRADLRMADLYEAGLFAANLRGADLRGADLRGADLRRADLYEANLRGANLCDANLRRADLREADLREADLREADLREANLRGADLVDVKTDYLTIGIALACPETGPFVGWKKCADGKLVELLIPSDAKRSSATTAKCRCDHALVLSIDGVRFGEAQTVRDDITTRYVVGQFVYADGWDEDRWNECDHGIHFFMSREHAVAY